MGSVGYVEVTDVITAWHHCPNCMRDC